MNYGKSQSFNDKMLNRRRDVVNDVEVVTIKMGGCYVTTRNETISTVLGSCVAACIRDRESGIGGMNHFMLPARSTSEKSQWENTSVNAAIRYGTNAMEFLINSILSKGGKRNFLEFKIFGGGNITGLTSSIGRYNIKFIKEYMKTEGYSIAAESLGGSHPIILNYSPKSGIAKIRRLDQKILEVASNEQSYLQKLETERIEGDIELFNGDK